FRPVRGPGRPPAGAARLVRPPPAARRQQVADRREAGQPRGLRPPAREPDDGVLTTKAKPTRRRPMHVDNLEREDGGLVAETRQFIERHHLWSETQQAAAGGIEAELDGLEM